jgi:DNA primase
LISKETIDRVQSTADIVEVVSDFVQLKKKGKDFWGCCPFHNEKSPSFSVSQSKGIYKCFGCGAAGDALTFVMNVDKVSYPDAIRYLANKYTIDIVEDVSKISKEERTQTESLYIVLNYAKNFFVHQLFESEHGRAVGLSYFKERGFSDATIKKFDLGYAPDGWSVLYDDALKNQYSQEHLEKAGLVTVKDDKKIFDRFRNRVTFPIHTVSGKVIAFGARILTNDKNQPKYLNSPETDVYHKSRILYGIFQAKKEIVNKDNCFLVEGYTDVLSLHQAGIENVVASSGTSLTQDQVRLIGRFTRNVTILYDGDQAGIKASLRGIDIILEEGLNVRICSFPDNDDPDSYVKKVGTEAFLEHIKNHTKDFIDFKTELVLAEAGNDPIKKASVIKEVVESICKIPDTITRTVYIKQTSVQMGISEEILTVEVNKKLLGDRKKKTDEFVNENLAVENQFVERELNKPRELPEISIVDKFLVRERGLIYLLIHNKELKTTDEELSLIQFFFNETTDLQFSENLYGQILQQLKDLLENGEDFLPFFESFEDEEIKRIIIDLSMPTHKPSPNWEKHGILVPDEHEDPFALMHSLILQYKIILTERMIEEKKFLLTATDDYDLQNRYMRIIMQLLELKKELSLDLGSVAWRV